MAPTVESAVIRTMFTAPMSIVYPRILDAENHLDMLTPADPELEVTLASVFCTESKTPSEESAKYRTATATKSMTQATTRSARRPRLPPAPAPVLALGRETPEKTAARRLVSAARSPVTAVSLKPVVSPKPAVVSPNCAG